MSLEEYLKCDATALAALITSRILEAIRIKPRVEFDDAHNIYDAGRQTKAVRFLDQR